MNDNLPPLPEPVDYGYREYGTWVQQLCYAPDQMREYGQLCRQQALEEIAVVFDAGESYRLLAKFIRSMK